MQSAISTRRCVCAGGSVDHLYCRNLESGMRGRRGESATTIFGSGVSKEVGYEPNIHGVPCFAWMGQWQCNVAVDGVDTLHTRVDDSSQEHGVNLETIKRPLLYALNMHRTYMDICGQA